MVNCYLFAMVKSRSQCCQTLSMMSHFLCRMLLLVILSSRAGVLATNSELICGYDVNCQAKAQLISTVNRMNVKLDELAARPADANEKLDKLATDAEKVHSKQADDLEELKGNMSRSLASSAAISKHLEKHSADLLRHDDRLKAHELLMTNMYKLVQSIYWGELGPQDCADIRAMGSSISGVYQVYTRRIATDVYCDFTSATESWLVFQRRRDGSQNFERTWREYEVGFGSLVGEFWLGNTKLSLLTMNKKYKLRIELEDFPGEKRWAEYSTFSVKPAADKYRLTIGGYSGNAGDSLALQNNMMFSTKDADNDGHGIANCAHVWNGAWWFNACHHSGLNGRYLSSAYQEARGGIHWYHWKGFYYSLKATEMKIAAVK